MCLNALMNFKRFKNFTWLQVIKESQKQDVLQGCHADELGGGHFGRDETLAKVSERYY